MIFSILRIILAFSVLFAAAWVNLYILTLPLSIPAVLTASGIEGFGLYQDALSAFQSVNFREIYSGICYSEYCFPGEVTKAYYATAPSMAISLITALGVMAALLLRNAHLSRKRITKILLSNGVAARYLCTFSADGELLYSIQDQHPHVTALANWLHRRPIPLPNRTQVHLIESTIINAFALTTLSNRPHIVITTGMLNSVDAGQFNFVMLHEVGHIKHLHSLSGVFMNQAIHVSNWASRGTAFLGRALNRFYQSFYREPLRFLRVVSAVFALLQLTLEIFVRVNWVFIKALMLLDKAISRKMEFQADAYAIETSADLAKPAIGLLQALKVSFDWLPNLSSTHPKMSARIKRIKKMNATVNRAKTTE